MNKKPEYKFPKDRFYPATMGINKSISEGKRYQMLIDLKGIRGNEKWLIIMKNPSRAGEKGEQYSDKTIHTVCEYFFRNYINVSKLVVMNLFPIFETDSSKLYDKTNELIDEKNKELLLEEINKVDNIVLAWGSHPLKCKKEFENMICFIKPFLVSKNCYQMKHPKFKLNVDKPLHGQVWGYNYKLEKINMKLCL